VVSRAGCGTFDPGDVMVPVAADPLAARVPPAKGAG
jgi:hypothetical protein